MDCNVNFNMQDLWDVTPKGVATHTLRTAALDEGLQAIKSGGKENLLSREKPQQVIQLQAVSLKQIHKSNTR